MAARGNREVESPGGQADHCPRRSKLRPQSRWPGTGRPVRPDRGKQKFKFVDYLQRAVFPLSSAHALF